MSVVLAVDLGGTNLRIGSVTQAGQVVELHRLAAVKDGKKLLVTVGDVISELSETYLKQGHTIRGIALGFPGIVDAVNGLVYQSPHFPEWDRFEVLPYFQKRFSWPVVLDNDANLIALGELWQGAGKGLNNFILLTLGTGVGGAVIIDGKIFRGDEGFAGEFGHIVIEQEGFHCHCGSRGCLEMCVSATGIKELIRHSSDEQGRAELLKKVGQDLEHLTVEQLYAATREGDSFGHAVFRQMGHHLGVGIASLVNAFGICNVLIGGGVSAASDFFLPAVHKELTGRTYRETARRVCIAKCRLGDKAGLIGGAASLWK